MTSYFDRKSVPHHQAYAILCRIIIPKHGWKIIRFNSSIIYVHFCSTPGGFQLFQCSQEAQESAHSQGNEDSPQPRFVSGKGAVNPRLQLTHFWEWETIGKPWVGVFVRMFGHSQIDAHPGILLPLLTLKGSKSKCEFFNPFFNNRTTEEARVRCASHPKARNLEVCPLLPRYLPGLRRPRYTAVCCSSSSKSIKKGKRRQRSRVDTWVPMSKMVTKTLRHGRNT